MPKSCATGMACRLSKAMFKASFTVLGGMGCAANQAEKFFVAKSVNRAVAVSRGSGIQLRLLMALSRLLRTADGLAVIDPVVAPCPCPYNMGISFPRAIGQEYQGRRTFAEPAILRFHSNAGNLPRFLERPIADYKSGADLNQL